MNFTSDNAAGIAPEILAAISAANAGSALAYGEDSHTKQVERRFAELFERGRSMGERHPTQAPPPPKDDLPIVAVLPAEPDDYVVFAEDEDRPWKVRAWAVDARGDCWPILPPHPDDGVGPVAIRGVSSWWPVDAPEDAA